MNPPPLLPWSILFWETLFLGAASVLGAFILFSFLPISTAVIVGALNLLSFSDLRDRLNPSLHMVGVAAFWLALNLVLYGLFLWLGRVPFVWMLG